MRFWAAACALLSLCYFSPAQDKFTPQSAPRVVTVPATIDHNRVIIDVDISLPSGSAERVRAWVDNGDPDLYVSQRVAMLVKGSLACDAQPCFTTPPRQITIGGMKISLAAVKARVFTLRPLQSGAPPVQDNAQSVMAPGLPAEMAIPSVVLRHYDVLIDFPGRKFTIGMPGSIHFQGVSSKVQINPENGLIQVPSQIENKKYNLALDLGSCISFLSEELFDKFAAAHPDWPHMTGAVGSANMWGADEETKWKVMRVDRLQYGPLFLTDVAVVAIPTSFVGFLEKLTGMPDAGILGSNAFLNYLIGLDYAHSTVYFDIGRLFDFPDFDVIGLILRPEDDGRFTVLGVADFDGKPSVPMGADGVQAGDHLVAVDDIPVRGSTMGQLWSMLGGTPGQERKLTIERGGKQFAVVAKVDRFLEAPPDEKENKKKK